MWTSAVAVLAGLAVLPMHTLAAPGSVAPSTMISNGTVTLSIGGDAAINQLSLGADSLSAGSSTAIGRDWTLSLAHVPNSGTDSTLETFTSTPTGAVSTVRVEDAGGVALRVQHDFHPSAVGGAMYEVLVTIENVGTSVVQPTYERTLGWPASIEQSAATLPATPWQLNPTADGLQQVFRLALAPLQPGAVQAFRLYVGGATDASQAQGTFSGLGGSLVSALSGTSQLLVFGYAAGAAPSATVSSDCCAVAASGSRGGGGGGGGGSAGGKSSSSSSSSGSGGTPGNTITVGPIIVVVQPSPDQFPLPIITITQPGSDNDSSDTDRGTNDGPRMGDAPGDGSGGLLVATEQAPPVLQGTPELESLALMGSGLLGAAGYGLSRLRALRRHDH